MGKNRKWKGKDSRGKIKIWKSSIAKVLLGSFLIFAVPAIAINCIISYISVHVARGQTETSYGNSIALLADQMEDFLYDIQTQSGSFLLDMDLLKLANSTKAEFDLYEYAQFYNRINLYARLRFAEVNTIVVLPKQGRVLSTEYGMGMTDEYDLLREEGGLPLNQTIWSIRPGVKNRNVTKFSLILGRISENQTSPYIVLEINREELLKKMKSYFNNDKVKSLIILDYQGETYYTNLKSPQMEKIAKTAGERLQEQSALEWGQAVAFPVQEDGEKYTGIFAQIEGTGAKIGVVYDTEEILRPIRRVIFSLTIGLLIVAGAGVIFIMLAYRRILSPVITLTEAMRKVKKGDFNVRVSIPEDNDLSLISTQFNAMVERIDRMIKMEYQMKIKLQDAELRFLKSQINPHFLYNSLFTLYNMIESNDLENASDMAIYLGKYYQQSAHLDATEINVGQELDNIRIYLKIHEMRFPGALTYRQEAEPDLLELPIPVLSLQTLVENAITHGFGKTPKAGNLEITVKHKKEGIVMSVSDDGNGISDDRLQDIEKILAADRFSFESHGIENVYQRIKIMYPSAQIRVEQAEPKGVQVTITIAEEQRGNDYV